MIPQSSSKQSPHSSRSGSAQKKTETSFMEALTYVQSQRRQDEKKNAEQWLYEDMKGIAKLVDDMQNKNKITDDIEKPLFNDTVYGTSKIKLNEAEKRSKKCRNWDKAACDKISEKYKKKDETPEAMIELNPAERKTVKHMLMDKMAKKKRPISQIEHDYIEKMEKIRSNQYELGLSDVRSPEEEEHLNKIFLKKDRDYKREYNERKAEKEIVNLFKTESPHEQDYDKDQYEKEHLLRRFFRKLYNRQEEIRDLHDEDKTKENLIEKIKKENIHNQAREINWYTRNEATLAERQNEDLKKEEPCFVWDQQRHYMNAEPDAREINLMITEMKRLGENAKVIENFRIKSFGLMRERDNILLYLKTEIYRKWFIENDLIILTKLNDAKIGRYFHYYQVGINNLREGILNYREGKLALKLIEDLLLQSKEPGKLPIRMTFTRSIIELIGNKVKGLPMYLEERYKKEEPKMLAYFIRMLNGVENESNEEEERKRINTYITEMKNTPWITNFKKNRKKARLPLMISLDKYEIFENL